MTGSSKRLARPRVGALVLAALAALAVSCGSGDQDRTFVVGAGDSAESRVLAEIYAGALARTGLPVRVQPDLGQRPDYLAALDEGAVDLVGEQTGDLLAALDSASTARTPDEVVTALYGALPADLTVADPADGVDLRPRLVVAADRAARDGLTTVADLLPRCADTVAGVAALPGLLRESTDVVVTDAVVRECAFAAIAPESDPLALRESLRSGALQAGLLTGPPDLAPGATDGLTVLADEDYAIRAENIVPLLRAGLLDEVRMRKLNYVAGELTTNELIELIRAVEAGESAPDLARHWLDAHGL